MKRVFTALIFALLLSAGMVQAGDVRGKVVNVDADKLTITIKVDDKEQTLPLASDVKVIEKKGKAKKPSESVVADGIKGIKKGVEVTLTSLPKDEKIVRVRIESVKK